MGAWVFTIRDVSGELTTVRVNLDDPITAANYDTYSGFSVAATKANDALVALRNLTAGEVIKAMLIGNEEAYNNALPANYVSAHREIKMAFALRDTVTGKRSTMTVGAPDMVVIGLPTAGTDFYSLILPVIDAWRDVLEDSAASPDGNAVEVLSAHVVGRNI